MVTEYSRRFSHLRPNLPLFLIGTQDALGARSPRVIDDSRARKLAMDLNGEYIETCATYGMNVDKARVRMISLFFPEGSIEIKIRCERFLIIFDHLLSTFTHFLPFCIF